MNPYGSVIKTFTARNVLTQPAALNPPAALTYTTLSPVAQLIDSGFQDGYTFLSNNNLNLLKAGIFCNFGDLAVYDAITTRIDIQMDFRYMTRGNPVTGLSQGAYGSTQLNGNGSTYLADLAANSIVYNSAAGVGGKRGLNIIKSVTNDTLAVLSDYPLGIATADANLYKLTLVSLKQVILEGVSSFNTLFSCESFIDIGNAPNPTVGYIVISAKPVLHDSFDLLTDNIPVAFAGSNVIFDVVMEIESNIQ